jgi:hypothetical protein
MDHLVIEDGRKEKKCDENEKAQRERERERERERKREGERWVDIKRPCPLAS